MSTSSEEAENRHEGEAAEDVTQSPSQPLRKYSRDFLMKFQHINDKPKNFTPIETIMKEENVKQKYDIEFLKSQKDLHTAPLPLDYVPGVRGHSQSHGQAQSQVHGAGSFERGRIFTSGNTPASLRVDQDYSQHSQSRRPMGRGQPMGSPRSPANATKHLSRNRSSRSMGQRAETSSPAYEEMTMVVSENAWVRRGNVSDTEAEIRKLMGMLNKLSTSNFDRLTAKMLQSISSPEIMSGFVTTIFNKAIMEPGFSAIYSELCRVVSNNIDTKFGEDCSFKVLLLTNCYKEVVNENEENEDEATIAAMSEEDKEYKRILKKRRKLGNMVFIGDLFKKEMFEEYVMHEIISVYLDDVERDEDEMDIEGLCKLLTIIGPNLDKPDRGKKRADLVNSYYARIRKLIGREHLASRIRFMMKDLLELRELFAWVPRSQAPQKKDSQAKLVKSSSTNQVVQQNTPLTITVVLNAQSKPNVSRTDDDEDDEDEETSHPASASTASAAQVEYLSESQFETKVNLLLDEFMACKDYPEAIECVKELKYETVGASFVEKAISYCLEKKEAQQVMVTTLLKQLLTDSVISPQDAEQGLAFHLSILDDLTIDIPHVDATFSRIVSELAGDGLIGLGFLLETLRPSVENQSAAPFLLSVLSNIYAAKGPETAERIYSESGATVRDFISPEDYSETALGELVTKHVCTIT